MTPIRAFIAIEIADEIRQKIDAFQAELKRSSDRISWTKSQNIHLTLKFLGEVQQNQIDVIANQLQMVTEPMTSFIISIHGVGLFPSPKKPRVLWAGVQDFGNELLDLAEKVDDYLSRVGVAGEKRSFKPHLTLGRVKAQLSRHFVENFLNTSFACGNQNVHEVVLMQSQLHPKGAIYTPLVKFRLT